MYKTIIRVGFTVILATICQAEILTLPDLNRQALADVTAAAIRYAKSLPTMDRQTLAHEASTALHYGADNWKTIALGTVGAWVFYRISYCRGFNKGYGCGSSDQIKLHFSVAKNNRVTKNNSENGVKLSSKNPFTAFYHFIWKR